MNSMKVPNEWVLASIGELNTYQTKNITPSEFPDETFELYSVPSFPTGSPEIVKGSEIGSSKQLVMPGDVLLCKINPRINRVWAVDEAGSYRQIASSEWIVIRQELLDSHYARYFLSEEGFRNLLKSDVSGVGGSLTRAQPKKVATYQFPVASGAEQKQIAAKLGELLAQVETINTRLATIPVMLKRFRQSVLAAAVSGRLTENWRRAEGVSIDEWEELVFKDLCHEITVGYVGKMADQYRESGIPFLRSQNVRAFQFSPENLLYISEDFHKKIYKSRLLKGDLAVVRSGAPGTTCVIPDSLGEANCSDLVIARPGEKLNSEFACIYMNSEVAQANVAANKVGVAQQHFNVGSMKKMPIHLPSKEEQAEIVRCVDVLFQFASIIEQHLNYAISRVGRLNHSILAKAFQGALTADWREQNPDLITGENSAEALLATIQKQRANIEKSKRTRGHPASKRKGAKPLMIVSILETLKKQGRPLDAQTLLSAAGYPKDASTDDVERFMLDVRSMLEQGKIRRERVGDQDVFSLAT